MRTDMFIPGEVQFVTHSKLFVSNPLLCFVLSLVPLYLHGQVSVWKY